MSESRMKAPPVKDARGEVKGVLMYGDRRVMILGGGHTEQYTDLVTQEPTPETYVHFDNCHPNKFNKNGKKEINRM